MKKSLTMMILGLTVAITLLLGAISVFAADPYIKLECENADSLSDDENEFADAGNKKLKRESNNIGGTFNGAWISFEDVEFTGNGADKFSVYYSKRPDRTAADAKIEIRLGSQTGEKVGEVSLPTEDGDAWGNYKLATANLTKTVKGTQDVFIVFRGTTDSSLWYIANVDYVEFTQASASNNDNNNGGNNGGNNSGDPTGGNNSKTGDASVVYIAIVAAAAAFGGLKLKRK